MTPHVRSVSHVAEFRVGATNAVLRPGEVVTVRGDGAHPRCGGPADGVVVKVHNCSPQWREFRAGQPIVIAMLNSSGGSVISVNDPRERPAS